MALLVKKQPASAGNVRDSGSILGSGRSPGGGHGNPLQHSSWRIPMNRRAWRATVHRLTKSQTLAYKARETDEEIEVVYSFK